ncbi:MAG: tetratricopeptide repeat protein [Pirellulales bacterium]
MATKQKQRSKHAAAGLVQHARRLLEKGDFKQALKDAKVCYRQQPGPEARQLLERAYLARGRQLCRSDLRDEAQAVVENLLELGVTDASVQQELPELLMALGLFDRIATANEAGTPFEEGGPLYVAAADHAVLRPEGAPASLPPIRQGAQTVRRALAALEAGNESEAMAALKDVPRASPFADWKYFVRGLAAYYREDAAEMRANWDRLIAGRFAARIAAPLQALADPSVVSADGPQTAEAIAWLGSEVLGEPITDRLQTLQGHLAAGRWREAVRLFRAASKLLGRIDATLPQQVAMVLYGTFVQKGAPSAVRELSAVAEPPPIDPRWNRGLAMAWEHSEDDDADGVTQAERHWRAYLDDLVQLPCLLPAERTLARALVWLRLGRLLAEESSPLCRTCGVRHDPDETIQRRAIECFETSLRLSPELLDAYQALGEAYREWDEPEQAAATWRRLVDKFPENLDTLLSLTDYHVRRDEPFAAGEFVLRAQRLKPLDPKIKAMVWTVHLASARHHALAGRWDEGRADLAAAEKIEGPHAEPPHLLVRRAALESKAGELGLANRLLDRACSELGEAAPVWLLMSIESRRYALLKTVVDEFEHRWLTSLKKSRRSAAVGGMCRMVTAHVATEVGYPGRDAHAAKLVELLQGCKRLKWQARDLRDVFEFLMTVEHEARKREEISRGQLPGSAADQLLADFAAKARRQFPDNAFFQFMGGEVEMRKGPGQCDRRLAGECFRRVLRLTENTTDPEDAATARRARERLDMLDGYEGTFLEDNDDGPDDEPFGGFALDEDPEGGLPEFSPVNPPAKLFQVFARVCRSMGLDPQDVLEEAAAGTPFRFRTGGAAPQRRKRK